MLVVNEHISIPLSELTFTFSRSSGPGGQNVNKVNTKATMRWAMKMTESLPAAVKSRFIQKYGHRLTNEGDLLITSQRYRDQVRNVDDCRNKLCRMILAVSTAPKIRKPTKPTTGSRRRKRANKEASSQKKQLRRPPKMDD